MSHRVCLFGIFDPSYARNRILKAGFQKNGYTVVECRVDPIRNRGVVKYIALYREYRKLRNETFEYVIVCFPAQSVAVFARLLFGKRIIVDVFLSLYDAGVWDRKVYARYGLRALYSWLLDWSSCRIAHWVLLDTDEHIRYFNKTFGVPIDRCIRMWVGADDSVFYPREHIPEANTFTVHFHGTFIPLHGVRYVIEAAQILRDEPILFQIVGSGQEFGMIKKLVKNLDLERTVTLVGKKPMETIPELLARAHIALGIFGDTDKTGRIIPNKACESMAMGKVVITADTPASRELLEDGNTAVLVPPADPAALAAAILDLKANAAKRNSIAKAGEHLFQSKLSPEHIVGDLVRSVRGR